MLGVTGDWLMSTLAADKSDHHPNIPGFEREAQVVLLELRPALAGILERMHPPVMRATELRRALNLDKKLCWSVFNAATASDARALASLLPGRRAMERFFTASASHGVPQEAIERARAAFERFEESVARHAGSRDVFETMVAEFGAGNGQSSGSADMKHKRTAFRANSLLWGRQARVCCGARIMHPSAVGEGMLDLALIKGMVGLRRTRRSVPLHTTAMHWYAAMPGDPTESREPQPLDPREAGPEAIGLLRDFCSQPLPEFRLCASGPGYRCHELVSGNIGPAGEVTYFTGESVRAESVIPGRVPGSEVGLAKIIDSPIEVFVADILMHRSIWDTRPPEVGIYAAPPHPSLELRDASLLPMAESAEYLGDGIDAARTPLIPRYAEMLSLAMDTMGWKAEAFRVFRCRVDYPVLSSRIRVRMR
jgi:hypothetical protein